MSREKISAIILAAGESKRMKAFKPLLPLGQTTVMERTATLFKSAGIDDVRVVIGHRAPELVMLLKATGVNCVVNESYRKGMFSSVVCGVTSLPCNRDGFFVHPVDIPLVRRQTILELISAFRTSGQSVVHPTFEGQRGHPPLIAFHLASEIERWSGEGGLRALLERHELDSLDVEVADECILMDLDTADDYEILQERCRHLDVPTERECAALLRKTFGDREEVPAHCRQVSRVAVKLIAALEEKGVHVQRELVEAAALLHDIARGRADHATVGAEMLRAMDYPRVAEIVAVHMDLEGVSGYVSPESIVYLADKLVQGDRCVALDERFSAKMARFGSNPDAREKIERRLQKARSIQHKIEGIVGRTLESVLNER